MSTTDSIDVRYAASVVAVLLPPIAMYMYSGDLKVVFLNIVLCFLFYLPGVAHAVYMIHKADPANGKAVADPAPTPTPTPGE